MSERRTHWDDTYTRKNETEVSWFQEAPARSLAFIRDAAAGLTSGIIDVGGGASRLVDALLAEGYSDLTVLDISEVALARTRARLGTRANGVSWIAADITAWTPPRSWAVWHDRAVFHFLTERAAQEAYLAALAKATVPGSTVILSTFATTGPERCSGLPVQRYSIASLAERVGPQFALYDQALEQHRTPAGANQDFVYACFRRL